MIIIMSMLLLPMHTLAAVVHTHTHRESVTVLSTSTSGISRPNVDMVYVSGLDVAFSVSGSHKVVNQSVPETSYLQCMHAWVGLHGEIAGRLHFIKFDGF